MGIKQEMEAVKKGLHRLAVFRALLLEEPVRRFLAFLDGMNDKGPTRADLYCEFVAALYKAEGNLGETLLRLVLESDNPAVRLRAKGKTPDAAMGSSLQKELSLFTAIAGLAPKQVAQLAGDSEGLPAFENTQFDFEETYMRRLAEIQQIGYGIFAVYHMFTLGEEATLLPVKSPDPQRLSDLFGYEREREQILINTRALLKGLPANNILLYGDAGTGKSSTVKAIGNEYRGQGLRLVEVRKNQLFQIPLLMDALADNPLKFILFIDDLSFPADDGDFTALKAILEGNVSARPKNIVVYATSNRRQIVRSRIAEYKRFTALRFNPVNSVAWVAVKSKANSFTNCLNLASEIFERFTYLFFIGLTSWTDYLFFLF